VIRPLQRTQVYRHAILGFDTEYTSTDGEYLSTQLASATETLFETEKITVDRLAQWCKRLSPEHDQFTLVSFFSLAELQFLPIRTAGFNLREYGTSFDCSFYSKRHDVSIRVFDLARFFDRQGLAKVAEAFGLKKLAWKRDRVTRADLKKRAFREYAINDAKLAFEIFNTLRAEFLDKGVDIVLTETPARTASTVFRANYVDKELANENSRARYVAMRATWGGRAEAFRRGVFPQVFEYDLPSAYPNAAVEFDSLPTSDWKEVTSITRLDRYRGGFAHVDFAFPLHTRFPTLPVIAYNKQFYPLRGREYVTFDEIIFALSQGARVDIIEAWGFKKGTKCFREYMLDALKMRKEAKGARSVAAKLLANSVIGKLAQRAHRISVDALWKYHEETGCPLEDLMALSAEELKALDIPGEVSVGACFMPEWNALITGRTRMKLSRLIAKHEPIYCATDAIWVTKEIKHPGYDATLKRSGPGSVWRTRVGNIGEHTVHHAIHNRAHAAEIVRGEALPGEYTVRRPLKLREAIKKGERIGKWVEETKLSSLEWDNKRQLRDNGETLPWIDVQSYAAHVRLRRERKRAANSADPFSIE